MARPTKFKESMIAQVVELGRRGATDFEIAGELGISVSTLNSWKKSNVGFLESLKIGKQIADARVQQSLYERAVGLTGPDGVYHPPHPTACVFWLKNRRPDQWRDTTRSEITGKDGGPVEMQGPPRPSQEEVMEFAKQLHQGFRDYRDEKTGEAAILDDHNLQTLTSCVADYAAGGDMHGRTDNPRGTGSGLAMGDIVRRKIVPPAGWVNPYEGGK